MTYITAHSGSDETRENSIEFARYFKDKSIDMLEVDVRKNKQNQLVLSHDELDDNTLYLTLREFFQEIKGTDIKINCDLKENNLEEDIYRLAKEIHMWDDICFSGYVSEDILKKWPNHSLMNIENVFGENMTVEKFTEELVIFSLETLAEKGAKYINIYYQFVTDKFEEVARKLNIGISVWTVNDLDDIASFDKKNIFNVTSRKAWEYVEQRR